MCRGQQGQELCSCLRVFTSWFAVTAARGEGSHEACSEDRRYLQMQAQSRMQLPADDRPLRQLKADMLNLVGLVGQFCQSSSAIVHFIQHWSSQTLDYTSLEHRHQKVRSVQLSGSPSRTVGDAMIWPAVASAQSGVARLPQRHRQNLIGVSSRRPCLSASSLLSVQGPSSRATWTGSPLRSRKCRSWVSASSGNGTGSQLKVRSQHWHDGLKCSPAWMHGRLTAFTAWKKEDLLAAARHEYHVTR